MTVFKLPQIETFIKKPDTQLSAILLHGPNDGKIVELGKKITHAISGDLNDPFNIVHLTEEQLKETAGALRDEALSLSFTGDRKIVRILNPGNSATKQIINLLSENVAANLILVEAGNLKKTSPLRKAFEQSKNAGAFACYEDTWKDSHELILQYFNSAGKQIDNLAVRRLVEYFGSNRNMLKSEIDKLLSYCFYDDTITLDQVTNLSDDKIESSIEEICDQVLGGNITGAISRLRQINISGIGSLQLLNSLNFAFGRLKKLRIEIEGNKPASLVIKSARPPIFFKRQEIIKKQLQKWSVAQIKSACDVIFTCMKETREHPEISAHLIERTLMNLTVIANRKP